MHVSISKSSYSKSSRTILKSNDHEHKCTFQRQTKSEYREYAVEVASNFARRGPRAFNEADH